MASDETTNVVVNRILNAPVATVWKLWTDPELVTKWWGPQDYTSPSAKIDLREGGSYIFSMRAPQYQGGAESLKKKFMVLSSSGEERSWSDGFDNSTG